MMSWNVELGKQISMVITIIVMLLLIIKYKKIWKENLLFMIGYIIFSCTDNLLYLYIKYVSPSTDTFFVIIFFIVFLLYLLYYLSLLYIPLLKKIQVIILILLLINTFVRFYLEGGALKSLPFDMLYIDILLLLLSIILFLYQTFNSDKILQIKNYLPFWISVSLLILFIGYIPILFFRATVSENIYFIILFILNFVSNGVLMYGLLWNRQENVRSM